MAIRTRLTRGSGTTLRRLLPIDGIGRGGIVAAGATSIMLRALLLLGKFAFIVALARYTGPATVGLYALLVTIITISIYAMGLEIHTFTTREIVSDDEDGRGAEHIQSHLLTVGGAFLIALPVVYGFGIFLGIVGKFSFPLLAAILLCEAIGQELGRYLMVMMRPVASNLLQFIRGAAWMPVPLVALLTTTPVHTINIILWSWLAGASAACAFGLWMIRGYFVRAQRYRLAWLGQAFLSARHYFVVALLTQVQYYSDRFIVQRAMGESFVGVYSFYQSFANTMMTFVQTGVIAVLLPRLLRAAKQNERVVERKTLTSMLVWSMALALAISGVLAAAMPFLLNQVQKAAYASALPAFYVLLVGNLLLIAGIIAHLGLYARRRDADLMRVALGVIPLGLVINIFTIPHFGILGASVTFAVTALLELAAKSVLLWRLDRKSDIQ
ncbi:lipopolysaccharide biosynthesis protein [Sphingomonas sp. CFBP 8764]|uniref:lipopolysaccharide biosynthesis protein n=1 Tax=Sphingomonas sp. CFBP 8764 TaxID=2775275 RepID=UPI0017869E7B|nr:lipopolysaccharide biosynthesis protein [Sphingomonas sp. CFBP 8764]MBD8552720.1 lipopolysaccharide biosynthesis protein [Sphingomonas sp. CFBP 8764]